MLSRFLLITGLVTEQTSPGTREVSRSPGMSSDPEPESGFRLRIGPESHRHADEEE